MSDQPVVREYFPDRAVSSGYLTLWREILAESRQLSALTWQFFLRDFKAMYQQTAFGYLWVVIVPLLNVGLFFYLNQAGLFTVGQMQVPYLVYAVIGSAFWQLFAPGVVACSQSLVSAGSMITKVNFPRESMVFAAFAKGIVPFGTQIILGILLMLFYSVPLTWGIVLALLAAAPLALLGLAFGLAFSLLNGLFRDIGNALPTVMSFILFFTPILQTVGISVKFPLPWIW